MVVPFCQFGRYAYVPHPTRPEMRVAAVGSPFSPTNLILGQQTTAAGTGTLFAVPLPFWPAHRSYELPCSYG